MSATSFIEYFKTQTRIVFVALSVLLIGINISHIFPTSKIELPKLILDSAVSLFLIVLLLVHFVYNFRLRICVILALYAAIANILFTHFVQEYQSEDAIYILLKNNIYYTLLIILAGIIINKFHTLIILAIIFIEYAFSFYIDKLELPREGYSLYIILYIVIAGIVYFFSDKLHEALNELQLKQKLIEDKNKSLNSALEELQTVTEDQQAKNERLQEMILSRDKFFSIISHDIKSPLNTIIGFIELMLNSEKKISAEKRHYYLNLVKQSGKNLSRLVNDLLEWSRSKTNINEANPRNLSIKELADSVCFFLAPLAMEKNVNLVNNVNEKHIVYADYNMIFTVLRNIISNAIKFSHPKQNITLNSYADENEVKISIMDQGIGIGKDVLSNLFKIGNNITTLGTNNERGTGLGLLLCKEFIKKNNGKIGVESEIGKGSHFWFSLPPEKEIKN